MIKISTRKIEWLLLLVTIAVYGNTVMNGFTFDDGRAVVYNSDIRSWASFFDVVLTTRGVRMITYMLDYSLFGASPAGYHIHNILWQIVAVLLAYRLSLRLVKDERAAFIAAFIFAIHPLHVEAVANVSNRKEMICFVFFLSSVLSYINVISAVGHRKKILWGGLSVFFFLLAFRSKEIAVTIPAIFVFYELLFVEKDKRILLHANLARFKISLLVILLALSISKFAEYIFLNRNLYYFHYRLSGEFMEYTHILNNIFIVFIYYLRHFFFPVNLLPDYFIPAQGSLLNLSFAFSFSCFVFYLYAIYQTYRANRVISFALLWFLVNYLVISPLNLGIYPLCDRYLYLPSLGLCIVSGVVLSKMLTSEKNKGKKVAGVALSGLLTLCFAVLIVNYNSYWENNSVLWGRALKKNPESRIGRINLAVEYGNQGRFDLAEAQILKMGEMDPRDLVGKNAKMVLSEAYYRRQDRDRAFEIYRSVVAKVDHANPNITYPYIMKFARFFKESGYYEEALKAYKILEESDYKLDRVSNEVKGLRKILEEKKSEEIEGLKKEILSAPGDIRPVVNLGIIYYNILSYDKAENMFMEALKINGNSFEARYNLGLLYKKTGRFEEAALEFEKAVLLRSKLPPVVHDNLGLVYMKLNRYEDAVGQFLLSIKAQRNFALSYLHLGNAYRKLGDDMKAIDTYKAFLKYWDGEVYYRRLVESELGDLRR
ncbi:MAG: tetratricopeptide repeat protein [bacterium]|nr:tetratricopeptide repeat protein [bacterium]